MLSETDGTHGGDEEDPRIKSDFGAMVLLGALLSYQPYLLFETLPPNRLRDPLTSEEGAVAIATVLAVVVAMILARAAAGQNRVLRSSSKVHLVLGSGLLVLNIVLSWHGAVHLIKRWCWLFGIST